MSRPVPFPDETRRQFLELFEPRDRSSVANVFYCAVRAGADNVTEVLATVAADLNDRVQRYSQYDEAWARRRKIVFTNRLLAETFAQYALDREKGDPDRLERFGRPKPEHDSHLEDLFAKTWQEWTTGHQTYGLELELTPQHEVWIYRIDFALVALKIAVELDGHAYHKTPEQRAHDAAKGRYLTMIGWLVFRFTGHEVHADPTGCAAELYKLALRRGAFEFPYEPIARKA